MYTIYIYQRMPHLANECHKYFPAEKSCDPASRRRVPALRLGPSPKLTLPTKLKAQYEKQNLNASSDPVRLWRELS